jgi:hypothetical protein
MPARRPSGYVSSARLASTTVSSRSTTSPIFGPGIVN